MGKAFPAHFMSLRLLLAGLGMRRDTRWVRRWNRQRRLLSPLARRTRINPTHWPSRKFSPLFADFYALQWTRNLQLFSVFSSFPTLFALHSACGSLCCTLIASRHVRTLFSFFRFPFDLRAASFRCKLSIITEAFLATAEPGHS